mmetsp:Transcript_81799/g.227792  ORF Transcript_81799/g.227792 Transcript_81799/m.227792 type:complete len:106 (-) Transcript_81799:295-612(-)
MAKTKTKSAHHTVAQTSMGSLAPLLGASHRAQANMVAVRQLKAQPVFTMSPWNPARRYNCWEQSKNAVKMSNTSNNIAQTPERKHGKAARAKRKSNAFSAKVAQV